MRRLLQEEAEAERRGRGGGTARGRKGEEKESDADGSAVNADGSNGAVRLSPPLSSSRSSCTGWMDRFGASRAVGEWGWGALLSTLSLSAKLKPAFVR